MYNELIKFIVELGKKIINSKSPRIIYNQKKDVKLDIDLQINDQIVTYLNKHSSYQIISEEDQNQISFTKMKKKYWVIDPLDGSLNYSRNIPLSCISVSLWNVNVPEFGCIYDQNRDELFTAEKGKCCLNNNKIYTSEISKTNQGILCTGFPSLRKYDGKSLKNFLSKIQSWKKIRAIGSAALSLAWVARGWADAYYEEDIRIWDVASGLALVKAAGGDYFIKENDRTNFVTAIATNGKISIEELL